MRPRLLLINPPILDFAAYDFWALPLGLLQLAGALQRAGLQPQLLDSVQPHSPWLPAELRPRRRQPGLGKLPRTPLAEEQLPAALRGQARRLGRRYARYGLPAAALEAALDRQPEPDLVLLSCAMTYWYPGVVDTAKRLRRRWPRARLVLGGIYATLCPEHARRFCGVDLVLPGPLEHALPPLLHQLGLAPPREPDPLPAHELAPWADAAALQTSRGCPHRCLYCGIQLLSPSYQPRSVERVEQEVRAIAALGLRDLALYDDAFLAQPRRACAILERIAPLGLRLHAAAGLACRNLSPAVARAMRAAGFHTVRLGLETTDPQAQQRLGAKATTDELSRALDALQQAGFEREAVGVYLLVGLPDQSLDEIERSVVQVRALGATVHLAHYSPVPGSPLFARAMTCSRLPLADEPLLHNPTLLPCAADGVTHQALNQLRRDQGSGNGLPQSPG